MDERIAIRRARLADAAAIAAVQVAAWRVAYRGLLPDDTLDRLSVEDAEARWQERIDIAWGNTFVAEQDGHIAGFVAGGKSQDPDDDHETVGEVYVLYVYPETWRQGLGKALIETMIECLREARFQEAVLWVLRGNQQAIGFYEATGFVADGASQIKQRADGTEMTLVRYRRRLECAVEWDRLSNETSLPDHSSRRGH